MNNPFISPTCLPFNPFDLLWTLIVLCMPNIVYIRNSNTRFGNPVLDIWPFYRSIIF